MCELKYVDNYFNDLNVRHTLTGVWVEIQNWIIKGIITDVTPSRVCELKFPMHTMLTTGLKVAPSRVCTENYDDFQIADLHPLRPKYKSKANHNHILINKNSAETFASAPNIIPWKY